MQHERRQPVRNVERHDRRPIRQGGEHFIALFYKAGIELMGKRYRVFLDARYADLLKVGKARLQLGHGAERAACALKLARIFH